MKALHAADIEVILDVVYNHTTELGESGPTYSYRGIDNSTYYLLEGDRSRYRNDCGTGNVLHCLIAEAWDVASCQLGRSFPGFSWLQWNGKFRDDIRSFMRGDEGKVSAVISRIYGSDDLFPTT